MSDESIESTEAQTNHIIQNFDPNLTARVSVSLSMQRNLGQYENCHFSIRYEQNCRPEERQRVTEILETEAGLWIGRRSIKVDEWIKRNRSNETQGKGQN